MCRLFGMSAGRARVSATFWLLDAPDSLSRQSHRNPDGTGLGTFDEAGRPVVEKQALAAWDDADFASEAKERRSATFVAHVRHSSGTGPRPENTHPFELDGRLFAHNGVVQGLPRLEEHLGATMATVRGDTDSERLFALVTAETAAAGGDVALGMERALGWVARHLPVYAVNVVLTTPTELWACRYPDTHALWLLDRRKPVEVLDHRSDAGTRVVSDELADAPCVVVASERLDDDPAWRMLDPGVLVRVGPDLSVTERVVVDPEPRHRLQPADLGAAAASQRPTGR
ncbi:glutamine amidotransferase [Terrabacter sp. Root85]|uniref:class II glutamine amidotransferase n=1 Tax=Terrabacter sp. Root85 TaxID=1736603 RepID=UPI0006F34DF4|nr:class II glutamine amidotransferase [Terrabacter sp. Root85]KRC92034.1 glutamine amidotransferase [Terrabacter sp. Root85]